jgi:glycosyltransferase involved in cell wall biosynthesis
LSKYNRLNNRQTHLLLLIGSLNIGGAERQVVELVKQMDKTNLKITVLLFYNEGDLKAGIKGIPNTNLLCLNKSGRWDLFHLVYNLRKTLINLHPDIVYSFMPGANILGLFSCKLAGNSKLVWGIRATKIEERNYHWFNRVNQLLQKILSPVPDAIIVNSYSGYKYLIDSGYKNKKMIVITNGINTEQFRPDKNFRNLIRKELGLGENECLIGMVARFDPMKDHRNFLNAAHILIQNHRNVKFLCIGSGPRKYKNEIYSECEKLGLKNYIIWQTNRNDMPAVYNAFDISTLSSSYGEGFSNALSEAMACGVPCVTTDVGDSAQIVGDTGIVVPPKNPKALADGWYNMLKIISKNLNYCNRSRDRILTNFNSSIFAKKSFNALMKLL